MEALCNHALSRRATKSLLLMDLLPFRMSYLRMNRPFWFLSDKWLIVNRTAADISITLSISDYDEWSNYHFFYILRVCLMCFYVLHVYFSQVLNILTIVALDLKSSHQSFLLIFSIFRNILSIFGILPVSINFYNNLLSSTEVTVEILLIWKTNLRKTKTFMILSLSVNWCLLFIQSSKNLLIKTFKCLHRLVYFC